jgi:hypothetical protein
MSPLEKELEIALLNLYESWKAFGRPKNIFLRMVKKTADERLYKGPSGTVRFLLAKPFPSTGFLDIVRSGHRDLTVEALILQPKWKQLFTDWDYLCKKAKVRLDEAEKSN